MFLGELSADGYGFALLDVHDLSEFLKERKCRAKKLLSYWDAHKQLFYDAVKGAKALPFYPLTVCSYEIFVCMDEEFAPSAGKIRKFNSTLKFGLQSGAYELCALGLKNSSQHFEKYGYAFIFKRNASAENQNFSRLDNDKFSFDICEGD